MDSTTPDIQRSKRNNNNRKRGKNLERAVAKELEWYRVPYSGSSDIFGKGDVVDNRDPDENLWLCECKTQTQTNCSIEAKWLKELFHCAPNKVTGKTRSVLLARRLYQCADIWVFMPARQMKTAPFGSRPDGPSGFIDCRVYPPYGTIVAQRQDLLGMGKGVYLLRNRDDIRVYAEQDWFAWWWPIVAMRLSTFKEMNPTAGGK